MNPESLYLHYYNPVETGCSAPGCGIIGRSSLLSTAEMLTRGEKKRSSCVEYVICVLIYDSLASSRAIIKRKVVHVATKIVLDKKISTVMEYINLVYSSHVETDKEPLHDFDVVDVALFSK